MPTRITNFLHDSVVTGAQTLGTAFDVADVHAHDLQADLPSFQKNKRNYRGIVEGIHIRLTSAAGASKVTVRICADAAGDDVLVPDTEADLVAGVTTAATKSAEQPWEWHAVPVCKGGCHHGCLCPFSHHMAGIDHACFPSI